MRRIVRHLAAVAVGLGGWAGAATAGDPNPSLVMISDPTPAAAAGVVPAGGCAGCAAGGTAPGNGALGLRIGAGCAMTENCSSFAQQRTFLYGSCRQFFSPGNDCAGPHCYHRPILYGTAGLGDHNMCQYGSYANR